LAYGAIQLTEIGLYDEALNLARGVGEIANLIAALSSDNSRIKTWIDCSDAERRNKFNPAKIRELLTMQDASLPILMDRDEYSKLSGYTHMAPRTPVGAHGKDGKSWIGPVYQEKGVRSVLDSLCSVIAPLAAMVCAYFKFQDLFDALKAESIFSRDAEVPSGP
jgi:hypothetical protein